MVFIGDVNLAANASFVKVLAPNRGSGQGNGYYHSGTVGRGIMTLDRYAAVFIISFSVKNGAFAHMASAPSETVMYWRITAAPELISKPADQT